MRFATEICCLSLSSLIDSLSHTGRKSGTLGLRRPQRHPRPLRPAGEHPGSPAATLPHFTSRTHPSPTAVSVFAVVFALSVFALFRDIFRRRAPPVTTRCPPRWTWTSTCGRCADTRHGYTQHGHGHTDNPTHTFSLNHHSIITQSHTDHSLIAPTRSWPSTPSWRLGTRSTRCFFTRRKARAFAC